MSEAQNEIIKSSGYYWLSMKICSICNRISGNDQDHLDCIQKIRIENEDENFKQSIPEKLDLAKDTLGLGIEVKAILEHLTKENKKTD